MAGSSKKREIVDLSRLCDVVQRSYIAMEPFRKEGRLATSALAGPRYNDNRETNTTYLDLLGLYVNIVSRSLIPSNPRVLLSTEERSDVPIIQAMEDWANDEIVHAKFARTMRRIVMDALVRNLGIAKVAIATPADALNMSWRLKAGSSFCMSVDPDDFVMSMESRTLDELEFVGHRFLAVKEEVEKSNLYNKHAREKLVTATERRLNPGGGQRTSTIGRRPWGSGDADLEDMVILWEIYVPRYNCIYTLTDEDMLGPSTSEGRDHEVVPLRHQEWIGPDSGPYHFLSFGSIPGNLLPKGPVQSVIDLHELANNLYRKLARQSKDLKDLILYKGEEDAARVKKANAGDLVPCNDPKGLVPITTGGPDARLLNHLMEVINRFSWICGNLETMGGLSTQANTATQEEMLSKQSNGQLAAMQAETIDCVTSIAEAMNWFWWHDPQRVMSSKYSLDGMPDIWVKRDIHPWNAPDQYSPATRKMSSPMRRSGPMPKIKVDPYSMRHSTPQQRSQELTGIVTQIFIPMAQLAQRQGVALDFPELMRMLGRYRDLPELKRIFTTIEPPAEEQAAGSQSTTPSTSPASDSQPYQRRDTGNNTKRSQQAEFGNMLSAAAANGQQQPQTNGAEA